MVTVPFTSPVPCPLITAVEVAEEASVRKPSEFKAPELTVTMPVTFSSPSRETPVLLLTIIFITLLPVKVLAAIC